MLRFWHTIWSKFQAYRDQLGPTIKVLAHKNFPSNLTLLKSSKTWWMSNISHIIEAVEVFSQFSRCFNPKMCCRAGGFGRLKGPPTRDKIDLSQEAPMHQKVWWSLRNTCCSWICQNPKKMKIGDNSVKKEQKEVVLRLQVVTYFVVHSASLRIFHGTFPVRSGRNRWVSPTARRESLIWARDWWRGISDVEKVGETNGISCDTWRHYPEDLGIARWLRGRCWVESNCSSFEPGHFRLKKALNLLRYKGQWRPLIVVGHVFGKGFHLLPLQLWDIPWCNLCHRIKKIQETSKLVWGCRTPSKWCAIIFAHLGLDNYLAKSCLHLQNFLQGWLEWKASLGSQFPRCYRAEPGRWPARGVKVGWK